MPSTLEALQERLGYHFASESLLKQAMTHRSFGAVNNERLEFLGDSVLNCSVASLLYLRFAKLDEGDLSRVRANLVKQQTLFEIAQRLEISGGLLLGEGEQKSGGFKRPSILADTLEALFGAIMIDCTTRCFATSIRIPSARMPRRCFRSGFRAARFRCRFTWWSQPMVPPITSSSKSSARYPGCLSRFLAAAQAAELPSRLLPNGRSSRLRP